MAAPSAETEDDQQAGHAFETTEALLGNELRQGNNMSGDDSVDVGHHAKLDLRKSEDDRTVMCGYEGLSVAQVKVHSSDEVKLAQPDDVPEGKNRLSRRVLAGIALVRSEKGCLQQSGVTRWIRDNIPGYGDMRDQERYAINQALSNNSKGDKKVFVTTGDGGGTGTDCWYSVKSGREGEFLRWDYKNKRPFGIEAKIQPCKRSHKRKLSHTEVNSGGSTRGCSDFSVKYQQSSFSSHPRALKSAASTTQPSQQDARLEEPMSGSATGIHARQEKAPFVADKAELGGNVHLGREVDGTADLSNGSVLPMTPTDAQYLSPNDSMNAESMRRSETATGTAADEQFQDMRDESKSVSPYSSLLRHFRSRENSIRERDLIAATPGTSAAVQQTDLYALSSSTVVATQASSFERRPNGNLGSSPATQDIGTQTSEVLHDLSSSPWNKADMAEEQFSRKVLENIKASITFSTHQLSKSYRPEPASVPQSVIDARLTKKQRMKLPGNLHISRLGHNTAVQRYQAICEHLGRKEGGDSKPDVQSLKHDVVDTDYARAQSEVYQSLEDLVEMPDSVVPFVYEGQLVFVDGSDVSTVITVITPPD
ncbi:Hypothetical protein D9617_73g062150 [Elsinoe fawcettii]|nr:Hypothetical protein D9617_73g062150 [Elsinoe fawcettii]